MPDTNLVDRIQSMRQKYINNYPTESLKANYVCQDIKKAKKLKKKLIALEKERCHKLIEHADISDIDQKIAVLKNSYINESQPSHKQEKS
ncbi:hypothetical protein [Streptococcus pseudoporcinus]|uniref:Uncharacterized protein n=1 Tax=Streptococcus pseudoporcinus TaxID=361101 RepID=A0A4U9YHB4_9STRE|nr:hypothetical protein [Streptococcus pseudoporcinus]VTS25722.1 Uncharacterised protein [Streptococcus pseudoporcinus]VUC71485.1 Uncharacterised protein [Streptococcus pseudoporcinus]VUD00856.1 Uncharacterised protein [Streptococcus pseudoporcinus]VUD01173.1 Uncharacterised protein [Streptococcus pseudoporcinus]